MDTFRNYYIELLNYSEPKPAVLCNIVILSSIYFTRIFRTLKKIVILFFLLNKSEKLNT